MTASKDSDLVQPIQVERFVDTDDWRTRLNDHILLWVGVILEAAQLGAVLTVVWVLVDHLFLTHAAAPYVLWNSIGVFIVARWARKRLERDWWWNA